MKVNKKKPVWKLTKYKGCWKELSRKRVEDERKDQKKEQVQ